MCQLNSKCRVHVRAPLNSTGASRTPAHCHCCWACHTSCLMLLLLQLAPAWGRSSRRPLQALPPWARRTPALPAAPAWARSSRWPAVAWAGSSHQQRPRCWLAVLLPSWPHTQRPQPLRHRQLRACHRSSQTGPGGPMPLLPTRQSAGAATTARRWPRCCQTRAQARPQGSCAGCPTRKTALRLAGHPCTSHSGRSPLRGRAPADQAAA
jgi:hypothetical protein